ncbi:transporter substrate-binding domain-containing protein [Paracoccus xiamenensis]|uniref:transporter substrate-binding domain-containing protein n=1 Tax=Paracoccus xiamenensis TaxID=2714901 RepID=UPI0014094961|nr:transporter substrate-binding domain-containing protein [Paracoccus xiamenensis]NHF72364.1 transporter substrate-binding domain-containing protein [Paracoccus xiamenensis]
MSFISRALTSGALIAAALTAAPALAEDLDKIKEAGVMRIAMSGAYPPFNFVNEQNEVVGFDAAIGTEIAKRMGVEAEIVTTAWDGIIGGLLANKYDAVVGSMSITEERQQVVDFVGPYYNTRRGIFAPADGKVKSVDDLKDATVGVTLGETHDQWTRDQGYNVRTYKGLPELLLELENGRVDAIVNDDIPVMIAIKEGKTNAVEVDYPEAETFAAGIAIRKDNPALAAEMQKALDAMMEDGTYLKIAEEWVGGDIR